MASMNEAIGQADTRIPGCHAIVLAGGAGRRMGMRKELLDAEGEPLLLRICRRLSEVAEQVTVVTDRKRAYDFLPRQVRLTTDKVPDFGPVAGICAGMSESRLPLHLVVACDYPFAGPDLWRALAEKLELHPEADAVLPEAGGKLHPLCALYRGSIVESWRAALAAGNKRVMAATAEMRIIRWSADTADANLLLMNMNTPEDYRMAKERWSQ
ncbi:molybdenum cofactor guanylyltransferase [Cohnella sp. JJ-181]|uniref:molybdenum cofactor guanylyltransferase n=1 Tax=Cohnella rhizoplanae TaxID=2974897 RepID=UPI0022FFA715|nr:molybdenum cofactor guanylyltransferase [Cohnella sp. JJ-181]CAI6078407.1 Molybdenum cofactor guanylyltransferase [Cohnella sp. JJ-181]